MINQEIFTFPSAAEGVTVTGFFFAPEGQARAIVQIAHGMIDRIGRYTELIEALLASGYAVAANDHIGHGETAKSKEEFGHFGRRGARYDLIADMHEVSRQARLRFGELPLILIGHSMGSFLARLYAEKWGSELSALVLLGTSGKNPAVPLGKLVADLISLLRGRRHRSRLLAQMTFMGYLSHFKDERSRFSWLTRDPDWRLKLGEDTLCRFIFTVSAYRELFSMLGEVNRSAWFKNLPKDLPILLASGDEDPVGAYGRGVRSVAASLCKKGSSDVRLLLYPDARHELHHETNRGEFFSDLLSYLAGVIG